jgi:hypothetical protein
MLKQKRNALFNTIILSALGFIAVGCGSKVGGTYTFSQTGSSVNSACSAVTLNLTSNSNQVSANGSNGNCTEILTGYDNGNGTITVQSLSMTVVNSNQQYGNNQQYNNVNSNSSCIYTGTLNVSGNSVSGNLTSNANQGQSQTGSYGYNNYQSTCGTVYITGTKNN